MKLPHVTFSVLLSLSLFVESLVFDSGSTITETSSKRNAIITFVIFSLLNDQFSLFANACETIGNRIIPTKICNEYVRNPYFNVINPIKINKQPRKYIKTVIIRLKILFIIFIPKPPKLLSK